MSGKFNPEDALIGAALLFVLVVVAGAFASEARHDAASSLCPLIEQYAPAEVYAAVSECAEVAP